MCRGHLEVAEVEAERLLGLGDHVVVREERCRPTAEDVVLPGHTRAQREGPALGLSLLLSSPAAKEGAES